MSELHELLAVEQSLAKAASKLTLESKRTLDKDNLFKGMVKHLHMFDDNLSHLNTSEHQKLETTVDENMEYTLSAIADYWNVVFQKECANQSAIADVTLPNGIELVGLPATFLLSMETKLKDLRDLLERMPTLPPGVELIPDPQGTPGVYVTKHDEINFKTSKELEFTVAYEATKEHPAQVQPIERVKNVGKYVTVKQYGMLPPIVKAERLQRVDVLLRLIKQARQRANKVKVTHNKIASAFIDFIMAY